MNLSTKLLATSLLGLVLAGCSSNNSPATEKVVPARIIDATFKASTLAQAKNSLLSVCSNNKLSIKAEARVVTCETKSPSQARERELTIAVNDEFAKDIREVFEFTLTEQGADVQVKANSFARYLAPVSVLSPNQLKNRNLLDDAAVQSLKKLLDQAGARN